MAGLIERIYIALEREETRQMRQIKLRKDQSPVLEKQKYQVPIIMAKPKKSTSITNLSK